MDDLFTPRADLRSVRGDADAVRELIERFAARLHTAGEPRLPVRVLITILCAEQDTMTARQLTEALGVSPPTISSAVTYLLHTGLIVRRPVPGTRAVHYGLPPQGMLAAVFRQYLIGPDLGAAAQEGIELVGGPESPGGRRLAEFAAESRFLDEEMSGIWNRWVAHQAAENDGALAHGVEFDDEAAGQDAGPWLGG